MESFEKMLNKLLKNESESKTRKTDAAYIRDRQEMANRLPKTSRAAEYNSIIDRVVCYHMQEPHGIENAEEKRINEFAIVIESCSPQSDRLRLEDAQFMHSKRNQMNKLPAQLSGLSFLVDMIACYHEVEPAGFAQFYRG